MTHHWNTHIPPTGQRAWVWNFTHQELATWDGTTWRTASGAPLADITHWRVSGVTEHDPLKST